MAHATLGATVPVGDSAVLAVSVYEDTMPESQGADTDPPERSRLSNRPRRAGSNPALPNACPNNAMGAGPSRPRHRTGVLAGKRVSRPDSGRNAAPLDSLLQMLDPLSVGRSALGVRIRPTYLLALGLSPLVVGQQRDFGHTHSLP